MSKTIIALAAAGLVAAIASPSLAKLNGTVVPMQCVLHAKEFAGPVEVTNTSGKLLAAGTKISVTVFTLTGKQYETIILAKALPAGGLIKGKNTYENVSTGCAASVFYSRVSVTPRG